MSRFSVTYFAESPKGLQHAAQVIAGEQSTGTFVRLPQETDELRARSGARIESIEVTDRVSTPSLPSRTRGETYEQGHIRISWPLDNTGPSIPNLLTTIAGNLFELADLSALRLEDVDLPQVFAKACPGPQFGAAGTRRLVGIDGPLIGTIIKPSIGLSADGTADLVDQLAQAGIDFIKDDELQANGAYCPLRDRVAAVMPVIERHAQRNGKKVMYAFNITDELDVMLRNAEMVEKAGGTCIMVSLFSVGLTGLRALRERVALPIHGHRAGWGLYSRSPHIGISFAVWQKLWRLAGADHLHVNGLANKFTEADAVVAAAARAVQQPVCAEGGPPHLAMPVYSSGQTAWQLGPARDILGNDDFIFCAGGGIISHPDGAGGGVRALRQAAAAARDGVPVQEAAKDAPELAAALRTFAQPDIQL
ncbi:ribulose-bisphosphate carboxylase large subunit family protein [Castellaniella sp. S9]|uniref:ribulose-bisphosphate carboxylase large subunit family protein n=1 Tax=Castellaniella sp. S9 TaxID=2993652 RepID=UPI0022B4637C|nr:ribulose-bisphosphate carboxylase large subunit family protein [Castellaniella sp. S9]